MDLTLKRITSCFILALMLVASQLTHASSERDELLVDLPERGTPAQTITLCGEAVETAVIKQSEKSTVAGLEFGSAIEMFEYGRKTLEDAEKGIFSQDVATYILTPRPTYSPISLSDMETFYYGCLKARQMYFSEQAKQQVSDPSCATMNLKYAMEALLCYRDWCFDMNSRLPSVQERLLSHKFCAVTIIQDICEEILKLNQICPDEEELLPILNICIQSGIQSNEFLEALLRDGCLKNMSSKNLGAHKTKIKATHFSCLVTLAELQPDQAKKHMAEARKVLRSMRSDEDKKSLRACQSRLKVYEREAAFKLSVAKVNRKESSRLKAIRAENKEKLRKERDDELESMRQQDFLIDESPSSSIQKNFLELSNRHNVMELEGCIAFTEALKRLELECEQLILSVETEASLAQADYKAIYCQLRKLIQGENFFTGFPVKLMQSFVSQGDINSAICRIEIMKSICLEERGNVPEMLQLVSAIAQNLNGNPAEWLAIEAEYEEQLRLKAEKKRAKKKAYKEKRLLEIQDSVATLEEKRLLQESQKAKPKKTKAIYAQPNDDGCEYDGSEPILSIEEQRQEKKERHLLAEKIRSEAPVPKDKEEADDANTLPKTANEADHIEELNAKSTQSLQDLFGLTGVAHLVDKFIEEDTWRFTREQLQTYFEALGCHYRHGKGSHGKIKLPSFMKVYQGDVLITIMNDFGGAVTLPSWEKNYVPNYLKQQILVARAKIRALKIKSQIATTQD